MRINGLTSDIGTGASRFAAKLPKTPVASAISGLIVAALILMTPNEMFEAIVVQTGLPAVLETAQPPLGAKARIVTAAIFAAVVTLAAWGALSVMLRKRNRHAEEIEPGLPRLRRADAHPDAPPRRPIFAHDDLGAPLDPVEAAGEGEGRIARMRARFADSQPGVSDWSELVNEAPVDFQLVREDPPEIKVERAQEVEAEPLELGAAAIIWEPQPPFEADPVAPASEPAPVFVMPLRELEQARAFVSEPDPLPAPRPRLDPAEIETLSALVDRLELGLALRRVRGERPASAPANVATHPTAAPGDGGDMDGALRDALDALKRLRR